MTLAATPAAVSRARQFARFALSARGLAVLAEDTELVVSGTGNQRRAGD